MWDAASAWDQGTIQMCPDGVLEWEGGAPSESPLQACSLGRQTSPSPGLAAAWPLRKVMPRAGSSVPPWEPRAPEGAARSSLPRGSLCQQLTTRWGLPRREQAEGEGGREKGTGDTAFTTQSPKKSLPSLDPSPWVLATQRGGGCTGRWCPGGVHKTQA